MRLCGLAACLSVCEVFLTVVAAVVVVVEVVVVVDNNINSNSTIIVISLNASTGTMKQVNEAVSGQVRSSCLISSIAGLVTFIARLVSP